MGGFNVRPTNSVLLNIFFYKEKGQDRNAQTPGYRLYDFLRTGAFPLCIYLNNNILLINQLYLY